MSREYWDGTNISPLTNDDRNQLLSVFERWDLEDFDVVAFGYTPVVVTLKVVPAVYSPDLSLAVTDSILKNGLFQ